MTLDLHANLGDLFFEALAPCGIVCSYVTYPHVDMKRTAVVASLLLSLQLIGAHASPAVCHAKVARAAATSLGWQ